jgi:tRNA(Met) cytidine acetyltransferase
VERWAKHCTHEYNVCWVGAGRPKSIPGLMPAQAHDRLGLEVDCLILELESGFSPDALAIAVGWVRGGGVLCLLVGALDQRPYAFRLRQFLMQPPFSGVEDPLTARLPLPTGLSPLARPELNVGQQTLLRQLTDLPSAAQGQCILLQAPRGRGKSTLLGALLAQWAQEPSLRVIVTARGRAGSEVLLRSAQSFLAESAMTRENATLSTLYQAPEQVLSTPGCADVLLIDEAAALAPQQLLQLIGKSKRSVLATTTTGFEGSGRYFDLRLQQALDLAGVCVRRFSLVDPVRWIPGDALEFWLDRLLLLKSEASWLPEIHPDSKVGTCSVSWYSGSDLASVEARLQAVMVLLREAHYRTRPSDLRRWLDDPALRFALLTGSEGLLGVLVVAHEPGLHPVEARSVFVGDRRPQGRFLPCVLAAQSPDAFSSIACWRVLRIVVHPNLRRCGIGRRLLAEAVREAAAAGAGFIGSSFGARPELLDFWLACGYQPVQIGFHRESVSGLHAAVVFRGLTAVADSELQRRRERFKADWPIWRNGPLRSLEEDVARIIATSLPLVERVVAADDLASVQAFARGRRLFEWSMPALHRWSAGVLPAKPVDANVEELWMGDVLRAARPWSVLADAVGTSGRAGVLSHLRKLVAYRLDRRGSPATGQDSPS